MYFEKKHEEAIVEYISTEDITIKNKIYTNTIYPAFNNLITGILATKKFINIPYQLKTRILSDCQTHLFLNINLFDVHANTKAYSYFTTTIYNFIYNYGVVNKKSKTEDLDTVDTICYDDTDDIIENLIENEHKLDIIGKAYKEILSEHEKIIFNEYFGKDQFMKDIAKKIGVSTYVIYNIVKDIRLTIREHLNIEGKLERMPAKKVKKTKI